MSPRRVLISLLVLAAIVLMAIYAMGSKDKLEPQIVILIGLDGFRSDYLEKYRPPTLSRLAAEGVTTSRMIPSFPSLTFPNLYTLATGLRPESHGIIGNSMYDPEFKAKFSLGSPAVKEGRWWGGEPIWLTAERQGLPSACMFWPGSEAEIGGRRPTDWRDYTDELSTHERVGTVLGWLERPEKERPRLITLYFHEVDSAGHRFGPDSLQTAQAVKDVDVALDQLLAGIKRLGLEKRVNFVCAADHGMTEVSPDRTISFQDLFTPEEMDVDSAGAVVGIRPKTGTPAEWVKRLSQLGSHFRVFLREEMPGQWHFRSHSRIAPIVMVADEGWSFVKRPLLSEPEKQNFYKATHGYPPELVSMGATFIAWGPAFRKSQNLAEFRNVEVYGLLCATLGIKPAANDGTDWLVPRVLR